MGKPLFFVVAFLCACFIFSNCSKSEQWNLECSNLLQSSIALDHRHSQLKASIDSLWDFTSLQLEHSLPSSIPPVDREIFLKSRNADHIRMFMSFKHLDPSLQSLVNDAGDYDAVLAKQMLALIGQRQVFEQQKIHFLRKIEKEDLTASRVYANKFRGAVEKLGY